MKGVRSAYDQFVCFLRNERLGFALFVLAPVVVFEEAYYLSVGVHPMLATVFKALLGLCGFYGLGYLTACFIFPDRPLSQLLLGAILAGLVCAAIFLTHDIPTSTAFAGWVGVVVGIRTSVGLFDMVKGMSHEATG